MSPIIRNNPTFRIIQIILICNIVSVFAITGYVLPARAGADDEDPAFEGYRRLATLGFEPVLAEIFANDAILAEIDTLGEASRLRFDTDGDGRIDCLAWRQRRTDAGAAGGFIRVVAVGAIEKLDRPGGAVRAETAGLCYLVDGNGDGIPERIADFLDTDEDGRADREDLYEIFPGSRTDGVYVLSYFDLDRDGRMLHLTDYGYHANRDEWESDFEGNVCFLAGRRDERSGNWTSCDENPFCFYDDDGDGTSDEAVRLEGENLRIRTLRWSFDADGGTPHRNAPDYDFSITATGSIPAPAAFADSIVLRDGRGLHFVSWAHARDLARWGLWGSALLVWDEQDWNVAPHSEVPELPRWEGVIADAYPPFPAVGGPGTGRVNKRYELARDLDGEPLGIYWSNVDERLHLKGAANGESYFVLPADHPIERRVTTQDRDGNGYFDTWTWSKKGTPDREITFRDEGVRALTLDAAAIRRFWTAALPAARDRATWDAQQLERSIDWREPTEIKRWWDLARDRNNPLAVRAEHSIAAERFLRDLSLWEMGGGFLSRDPANARPGAAVPLPDARGQGPIEIDLDRLPEDARDLLVAGSPVELVGGGGGGRVAGQVETDRLYFPATPPGKVSLEIDPARPLLHPRIEQALSGAAGVRIDPWFGTGVAFENDRIAYRTYDGHIDVFAKRSLRLILRTEMGDYHRMQPWGIDALEIGDGPGLGDLYIASEGDPGWIPLFGPDHVKEQQVIADGPLRTRIVTILQDPHTMARIRRTLSFTPSCDLILVDIEVERCPGPHVDLGAVLPALAESGPLPEGAGIWSYGPSVPEAGALGLAGAVITSSVPARITNVGSSPGITIRAAPGESFRFAWMAGGRMYGDSTAAAWRSRASTALSGSGSVRADPR
jgi:hypothetical protein